MTHIAVFIYFGWFDRAMDRYGISGKSGGCGIPAGDVHDCGDGAVVWI